MKEKKYTLSETLDILKEEHKKVFTIINYILNKNSHPLSKGGIDHEGLLKDLQDYEEYLLTL